MPHPVIAAGKDEQYQLQRFIDGKVADQDLRGDVIYGADLVGGGHRRNTPFQLTAALLMPLRR